MEPGRMSIPLPIGTHPVTTQMFPPNMPPTSSLWQGAQLQQKLKRLLENINLLKALAKELDVMTLMKESGEVKQTCNVDEAQYESGSTSAFKGNFIECRGVSENVGKDQTSLFKSLVEVIKKKYIGLNTQQCMALQAGKSVESTLRHELVPLDAVINQTGQWEERAAAVRLADKKLKIKRNRRRRKRKRQAAADSRRKECESFEKVDQEADDWRARQIAKDMAKRKVEKMKEIAKIKAKEEKQKLESELELVLIVEKLKELRSIRIEKLKKQGHFLPDEDNKFLERVRAAVEEEERQAAAAADTRAAKDAIANAEEYRKAVGTVGTETCKEDLSSNNKRDSAEKDVINKSPLAAGKSDVEPDRNHKLKGNKISVHDAHYNLPAEFYHYYHGSNADLGTLIEVRRMWDAFIMPGGSRIPPHWVQASPPADEVWASYLVNKEGSTKNQAKRRKRKRENR